MKLWGWVYAYTSVGNIIEVRKNDTYKLSKQISFLWSFKHCIYESAIKWKYPKRRKQWTDKNRNISTTISDSDLTNTIIPNANYTLHHLIETTNGTKESNVNTFHLNVIPSAQEDTLAIFKREDFIDSFDSPDELNVLDPWVTQ